MNPPTETFDDFLAIVRRLRLDCPWDREQTHASIAPLLVEEAYEVKESIEENIRITDKGIEVDPHATEFDALMSGFPKRRPPRN